MIQPLESIQSEEGTHETQVHAFQPTINTSKKNLAEQIENTLDAIQRVNRQEPILFLTGNTITEVINVGKNKHLTPVNYDRLSVILAEIIRWHTTKHGKKEDCYPPPRCVKGLLATPDLPLPPLERVVTTPTFAPDGSLQTQPGYHQESRTWYDETCRIPEINQKPSPEAVREARGLLLEDALVDFPFVDEASRTHAVAALLLPFVREMIPGPTPLHLIDSVSGPGTGKGLLTKVIHTIATGTRPMDTTEGESDAEWRKRITALLKKHPNIIVFDNITKKLQSASLSAALTTSTWQDRELSTSKMLQIPVRCLWLATGNNIKTSHEMARRSITIELDAKRERPWQRSSFKHKDLMGWIDTHRGQLAHACLTLIQNWIAQDRPEGKRGTLGSFEDWSAVMGGILACAKLPGFLANLDQTYAAIDEETAMWSEFLSHWWERFAEDTVQSSTLYPLAREHDLLAPVLGEKSERSQRIRLGKALRAIAGRYFSLGEITVTVAVAGEDSKNKTRIYRLEVVTDSTPM